MCNVCPKSDGWPIRLLEKKWRATFKCKHRYNTDKTICAVPCDGIDDLCLNYEDEDNCKIPSFMSLLSYVALAGLLSGLLTTCGRIVWEKQVRSSRVRKSDGKKFDLADIIEKNDMNAYQELRETQYLASAIQNFISYARVTKNVIAQRALCMKLFGMEKSMHEDEALTHIFILQNMGTNDSVGWFYDLLDKSLTVKFEENVLPKLALMRNLLRFNSHIRIVQVLGNNFMKLTLYYTDVCKDVLLAELIYSHVIVNTSALTLSEEDNFPVVMFFAIVASILIAEFCNLVTLITHPEFAMWPRTKRVISAILTPLMPAYILLSQFWQELNLFQLVGKMKNAKKGETRASLAYMWQKSREKSVKMTALLYEFRANENSTEHLFQLVLLAIIIEFARTSSPVLAGFNKVFVEEGSSLVYLSALMSVFSLVRGPVAYLKSLKNGFLGIIGSIILIFYFAIGTMMRLFMIMLLFTPILGLFDTMNHYTKGNIESSPAEQHIGFGVDIMYDITTTYPQHWNKNYWIPRYNQFFSMSTYAPFAILTTILVMHLLACFMFTWPLYKKSGDGIVRRFMRGIHTLCNVPLFCDWEEFYRNSDFKTPIPVCWLESKKLFAKFQLLFFIEHALMMIPIVWLKLAVDKRHTELEQSVFKPIPAEVLSKQRVDLLLGLGIAVPIVGSLLQAGIAYAYFRFGHPWTRVLRSQVFSPKTYSQNKPNNDENNAEEEDGDGGGIPCHAESQERADVEVAHGSMPESPQPGSVVGDGDQHSKDGTDEEVEMALL